MPAYFTVEFSFCKSVLYSDFVQDIYQVFFAQGMVFKEGFWHGKDMKLQEIIRWNQNKLEAGFSFGLEEDVKLDYRQITLTHPDYSELRLLWSGAANEICLSLLIPEEDIIVGAEDYAFIPEKIMYVMQVAQAVWLTGKAALVQSCLELEGVISLYQATEGVCPCIDPFAIVAEPLILSGSELDGIRIESLANGGGLLQDESLLGCKVQAAG
ncbi:hypothetical protein [Azotosporobacter soli]|uniref:hypothetical protein n=1 Tax=Azotosporobacter soli TaxID=3055040 RepID=UPI0031FE7E3B